MPQPEKVMQKKIIIQVKVALIKSRSETKKKKKRKEKEKEERKVARKKISCNLRDICERDISSHNFFWL